MDDNKNNTNKNLNEESLVSDLKESLTDAIEDASVNIKKLIENLESTIQDNKIPHETIEILNNFSKDLRESLELKDDKSINKTYKKNNFKEEE